MLTGTLMIGYVEMKEGSKDLTLKGNAPRLLELSHVHGPRECSMR